MKTKSNKSSITKKSAWSLVLAAKEVKNSQNDDSTIFFVVYSWKIVIAQCFLLGVKVRLTTPFLAQGGGV